MSAIVDDLTLPTRDLDDSPYEHDNDASEHVTTGQNGELSDGMDHGSEDEGLFGSDSERGETAKRRLDDEPDSAIDDVGEEAVTEEDYEGDAGEDGEVKHEFSVMDVELGRHNIPQPSDGEMYLFKVPQFLSFEPRMYDPEHFDPQTRDPPRRDSNDNSSSYYNKAMATMRWRRSLTDPSKLESNARFIRWSDGSLTLQLATMPQNQYIIKASSLAPPQRNPAKPTPTSIKDTKGSRRANNLEQESFTYLASPHHNAGLLRITNKFTTALKVQPLKGIAEDSLDKLKLSLAAAVGANGAAEDEGISLVEVTEDPELAKKRAELAERDKQRAQRRREAQETRDRDRTGRVLGRRGLGGPSGLTVGGLEDDEEMGSGAGRLPPVGRRRAPPRGRRGEILSDDDDGYGRRGRTKEDEYDEEDDFVARSDEEEEVVESDSDEDEGLGDFAANSGRSRAQEASIERQATPKRDREEEGTPPALAGTEGSPTARAKRRRIIEDDEDE